MLILHYSGYRVLIFNTSQSIATEPTQGRHPPWGFGCQLTHGFSMGWKTTESMRLSMGIATPVLPIPPIPFTWAVQRCGRGWLPLAPAVFPSRSTPPIQSISLQWPSSSPGFWLSAYPWPLMGMESHWVGWALYRSRR